jgi:hypothetical protein
LICAVAIATGIAPSVLWEQDARDIATMVDVLNEQRNG